MRNHNEQIPLIGNSPAMTGVRQQIRKYALADCNVLVLGPSGTGKELVARSIHNLSKRSAGPFIAVNCAALPVTLVESELFGVAKGAFTHAVPRIGRFQATGGGTIFLDEIGDTHPEVQAKLLRALEERVIQRVGSNTDISVDCRVVAATNRDLDAACKNRTFREDLYHRLAVAVLRLPPLGERTEDIPRLVEHFVAKLTLKLYGQERAALRVSGEAVHAIMRYSFPGNVRELENAIESAILLSDGEIIRVEHLPETIRGVAKQDCAALNPPGVPPSRLLEALTEILPRAIRIVRVEHLARFLSETGGRWFSRKDFEVFLRGQVRDDMNKNAYGTAGRYLRAIVLTGVLEHNEGKANKSRFRVSKQYLVEN
ncbi:MAG TPA: sigma-54 dependent transcriptional regulator [Syntrophobacteraceae bacterium]|nr:sigma-54 dependent transcriptional regulator [Syntrophobacteraceae bacterium]